MEAYVQPPPKGIENLRIWMRFNNRYSVLERKEQIKLGHFFIPGIVRDKTKYTLNEFLNKVEYLVTSKIIIDASILKENNKNRRGDIVLSRQLIFYFMRKHSMVSLKAIGEFYGKDHASVIHGVKTINKKKQENQRLNKLIKEISGILIKYEIVK